VELCHRIVIALNEAELDSNVGAVLLDAAGPAFCAGMDLKESLLPNVAERTAIHEELFTAGARATKPIVAAIQGPALAGGLGLVANAHIAVAADTATFGLTEIRVGLWPFVVFRAVSRAIGERRAVEISLTSRIFSAGDALAWGLVHDVVPAAELNSRANDIAACLSQSSPVTIRRGLDFVRESRLLAEKEAGELASSLRCRTFESADFAEGVRAFLEKRKPRWPSLE
jgi:enoyl-CoA hydratase/carnithine racemase